MRDEQVVVLVFLLGTLVMPVFCLSGYQVIRTLWGRRAESRLVCQTISYLHEAAFEISPKQPLPRIAEFALPRGVLDELATHPANADLVAFDAISPAINRPPAAHSYRIGTACSFIYCSTGARGDPM